VVHRRSKVTGREGVQDQYLDEIFIEGVPGVGRN